MVRWQRVIKAVRRAKLFVFLRRYRHELFTEEFQAELAGAYVDSPKGQPPVPPARLALAVILRAYTGVSDDEVAPVLGGSSLKAALDLDWDDPAARDQALVQVLGALDAVEEFVAAQPEPEAAEACLTVARQVREQDVAPTEDDMPAQLRRGVAKDRRISVEDPEMRHGRKSKSTLVDGYKRHILRDLDSGLVPAVGLTPANAPEASVTNAISADLAAQHARLVELAPHRPGVSGLRSRPGPRRGPHDLLQGLAGPQHRRAVRQDRVPARL